MALTGEVFGDQDVARAEALHGAVADLDIHRARQREDRVTPGRVVPRIGALGLEAAHDDPAAGNQLGALRLVTERLPLRHDLLEMRLVVGTRVDVDDRHGASPRNAPNGYRARRGSSRRAFPRERDMTFPRERLRHVAADGARQRLAGASDSHAPRTSEAG